MSDRFLRCAGKFCATMLSLAIEVASGWEIVCVYGGKDHPWKIWYVRERRTKD